MPFRHKAMLLIAFEIAVAGFTQADRNPYHSGITVEAPAHPDHRVTWAPSVATARRRML